MPSILAATDFSSAGNNAVMYACQLASKLGCDLNVLHTYMLPIATGDQPFPLISIQDMEAIANERMKDLVDQLSGASTGVNIMHRITYGDWRDAAEENAADALLLVVGNDADTDSWLGSNTLDAARSFGKPLLAIPEATTFTGISNITLACDAAEMHDLSLLKTILTILRATGASLRLVHVQAGQDDNAIWDEASIATQLGNIPFSCHSISSEASGVDSAIHQFAVDQHAEWLAVIPHHHSFFQNLFGKSHTRAALKMGDIPILSVH